MKLHGPLSKNLENTVASIRRFSGRPVHSDTIDFWRELVEQGRRASGVHRDEDRVQLTDLAHLLALELKARGS
ncbi:hypothetical protein ACH0AE_06420 [Sphingomonas sp. 179-A 2A2 NHS]